MKQEYTDIIHRCFRCGWCKLPANYVDFNCPSYLKYRFESFASGGRMWLIRAWLSGEIEPSERLARILFSCTTCKNCVETCAIPKIKDMLVDIFISAREDFVNTGIIPPAVRDYLKAMSISGNPYKRPQEERGAWSDGLGIPAYNGQEYLFYVGDEGSYDEIGMKMARATAGLLRDAGVSFGILGAEETSDGNEVKALGEAGLALHLMNETIRTMAERGVKKIITLSPHGYNAFRNDYPALGGALEVYHYTQIFGFKFNDRMPKRRLDAKVTFHDPCYLGRWNNEYWAPRFVLGSVPGISLVEMERSREQALCCGGGGGNFFTDMIGSGRDSSASARVREAVETGAEILAVACPVCYKMFDDAVKAEGLEGKIRVRDVAGIVCDGAGDKG
ncbi:MAG: (Fe-S)-binding protein [Deltaproteobacteria bacterium]|nr:(Fe-S)-binding protein [Deltaproteobacteria bacterium]